MIGRSLMFVRTLKSVLVITLLVPLMPVVSLAGDSPESPNRNSPNVALLGRATYVQIPLYKIIGASVVWTNPDLVATNGVSLLTDSAEVRAKKILARVGYAAPAEGEAGTKYGPETITALVDANGGVGLDGNYGSGRAAIIGSLQIKGSGKTPMVNPNSDTHHRNGASHILEGMWESVWSTIALNELPYGAYGSLAIIKTGGRISSDPNDAERALIIREDPVRPAHYVLNQTRLQDDPDFEHRRISEAMERIVEALPKPVGYVSRGRAEDFQVGIQEFIHRQAVQQGYMWAHSLMHGALSPSNTGLDGRALDFGSFSAFDGYARAKIIDDEGYFGEKRVVHTEILKDMRDSWLKTLPEDLKPFIGSEAEWFTQYDREFDNVREAEMVRVAGAFTELVGELGDSPGGRRLGRTLIHLAEAGNEETLHLYKGESPFGRGLYNIPKILVTLARADLASLESNDPEIITLIPDETLRRSLVTSYKETFELQRRLAAERGLSETGEASYRLAAVKIRNRKMRSVFRVPENYQKVEIAAKASLRDPSSNAISTTLNSMVSESRREFWDAAPYTIVLSETRTKAGDRVRRVLDGRTGDLNELTLKRNQAISSLNERGSRLDSIYRRAAVSRIGSCSALFGF